MGKGKKTEEEKKRRCSIIIAVFILAVQLLFPAATDVSLEQGSVSMAAGLPEPVCRYDFNDSIGTASPVFRENDTAEGGNTGTIPICTNFMKTSLKS